MNDVKFLAGLDIGHVDTKAIVVDGQKILGYCTVPTRLNPADATKVALEHALENAKITYDKLAGIAATGIFKEVIYEVQPKNTIQTVPEYVADVKGALFLNKNSRTIVDMGGNTCKAITYDQNGVILDVIYNDKCAEGLGIFYTTMAKALGLSEEEMTELAFKSTKDMRIATQCAISAELDVVDLLCREINIADVANAIARFVAERVAATCTHIHLTEEVVGTGGLAKSKTIIQHLSRLIKKNIHTPNLPEYVGAIGAVMSYER